mgnify:CR=1 FL=1
MIGAEKIYAKGHPIVEQYPLHTMIYEMRGEAAINPEKLENLFPVTEKTVGKWRQISNERMRNVDCAATQTFADEKFLLETGGAYFVHHEGELLGIGLMKDSELMQICAVKSGVGERVAHTLLSTVEGSTVRLEVASTNERAIRLYERLGFIRTREISRWYRVK